MEYISYTSEKDFLKALLDRVDETIRENFPHSTFIALSGGSTPSTLYKELAESSLSFATTTIYQVDERWVPPDHPDSNYKLIWDNLFRKGIRKFLGWYYFDTSCSLDDCLIDYERKLNLKRRGFDLCFLGIGNDGHIASLFPHSEALSETVRLATHTQTSYFPVRDRVTITFPEIMASKKIIILVKGREKQKIINTLLHSPGIPFTDMPAKKLLEHDHCEIHHLIDPLENA